MEHERGRFIHGVVGPVAIEDFRPVETTSPLGDQIANSGGLTLWVASRAFRAPALRAATRQRGVAGFESNSRGLSALLAPARGTSVG
jgi:hypothetical protein